MYPVRFYQPAFACGPQNECPLRRTESPFVKLRIRAIMSKQYLMAFAFNDNASLFWSPLSRMANRKPTTLY